MQGFGIRGKSYRSTAAPITSSPLTSVIQDVILYDFFANSRFSRWRILETADSSNTEFDPLSDQALLYELKQLYVAVTRARSRLFIYDGSEKGDFLRHYLASRKLVVPLHHLTAGHKGISIAKRSTAEKWDDRGAAFVDCQDYEVS